MCGFSGIYNINNEPLDTKLLDKMTKLIRYRGPDDEGFLLVNTNNGKIQHCYGTDTIEPVKMQTPVLPNKTLANLGFGFRRLSILDLSEKGHQPMSSNDKSIWIVFNGEIYNYIELRSELENLGYSFKSASDTEVIINAYQQWGYGCLNRFNGMWAFALWDNREKIFFCARDRFGIKPFYYFYDGNYFIFASEIKQILLNNIDYSLNEALIYRSIKLDSSLVCADETYFNKIKQLPRSNYLIIKNKKVQLTQYYDLDINTFETSTTNFKDAVSEYREIFKDAIRLRMRSDVEVGSCLSGGLDSSAIVTISSGLTNKSFKTFSAFYDLGPRYDERKWINLVTQKTHCNPYYISPTPEEFWHDLNRMTFINDFPVTGSSFISQHYVMKLAHDHNIKVLLDGQGSDEITGGYNHTFYRYYADLIRSFKLIKLIKEYPFYLKYNQKGSFLSKTLKTILAFSAHESTLYKNEARYLLENPLSLSIDDSNLFDYVKDLHTSKMSNFLYNLIMNTVIQTLLHFEDRNSMAYSIESRVPFLDYRLVEFAFRQPSHYKIHKNFGKYIHREALRDIVPQEIIERKDKVNFTSPGETIWLRGELKERLEDLFQSLSFKKRSIYNHKLIAKIYNKFKKGNQHHAPVIWRIMALEKWFQVFIDKSD